ncbi:C1 family peptidase [bacterium]|nr:C1 family peptidase [bacterium]
MKFKKYNWLPDIPDNRDKLYVAMPTAIPDKVDLRPFCPVVENQGSLGSCSGNAIVGALEILINKNKKTFVDLSRLFVYYNERVMERTVNIDAGAIIRDGIKTIAVSGVCTELLWPYDIAKFRKKPTAKCYVEATKRIITSYSRLITFEDKLNCLASGFPFVFGFSVYDSFETEAVSKTGIMVMPNKYEKFLGGHAVCAVGYDKIKQVFIVRNSWGPEWGDAGYFYMPFDYVANNNLSDDFWKIQR